MVAVAVVAALGLFMAQAVSAIAARGRPTPEAAVYMGSMSIALIALPLVSVLASRPSAAAACSISFQPYVGTEYVT